MIEMGLELVVYQVRSLCSQERGAGEICLSNLP